MVTQELQRLDREVTAQERLYEERDQEVQRINKELETLSDEIDLLEKVDHTLQAVSAKVLGQSTSTIDQLVTSGLKAVFYDQSLEFKTVVDKYRGKTSIRFELFEDGQTAPLMDSFGGGVLCIIGTLLRVTTIIVLGQRRILLLDESLAHLSEQYVPQASALLKKICSDLDFNIVMVTHEQMFAQHADMHYVAKRRNKATVFDLQSAPPPIATT